MAKLNLIPVIVVTLAGVTACPKEAAPPAPQVTSLPQIKLQPGERSLLTYFTGKSFETTPELGEIPEARRGWVRFVDLRTKPERRRDHEMVYVADLRKAKAGGDYPYVVMSRRAFELSARNGAGGATDPPSSRPVVGAGGVILYSTSWCSACKAARRYLNDKGVSFTEKDIEKDPQAAAELMRKAQAAGVSASGVPVIDVRGKLMQGFDPQRLQGLLGAKR